MYRNQDSHELSDILSTSSFQEQLLGIMDHKHHWAWIYFSGSRLTKEQLKIHFQQEYSVYVRDFPVFLARIYGNNPPPDVRALLAENIYEEDTGRLSLGRSHPELFLAMMEGLGFSPEDFSQVSLLPASKTYRTWLEHISLQPEWVLGIAALTIFVEGSVKDRKEIQEGSSPKSTETIEEVIQAHPMVQFYGATSNHMDLIRAHQMVEARHRHDAYSMVFSHAQGSRSQQQVLACLREGLDLWLQYRDGIAKACGLRKP